MLLEIQCLPSPLGMADDQKHDQNKHDQNKHDQNKSDQYQSDRYKHIEAAIAVIEKSGLVYEVGALGTTVEGEPDRIWALARSVHEAALASGADSCVSIIKVAESRSENDAATIDSLVRKFR